MTAAKKYYATIRLIDYGPMTLQELSDTYSKIRDESGEGASTFDPVNVRDFRGLVAGHISYNGRVWPGHRTEWHDGLSPLYDNRIIDRPIPR